MRFKFPDAVNREVMTKSEMRGKKEVEQGCQLGILHVISPRRQAIQPKLHPKRGPLSPIIAKVFYPQAP
jgi:hypothetical protein